MLQASQVKLLWDPKARAVLALTSSDMDPANKSYYGDAKLHLLAADGAVDALVSMKVSPALFCQHMQVVTVGPVAVLALTSSDMDPANKSSYGNAKLHLLAADGAVDALVSMKVCPALFCQQTQVFESGSSSSAGADLVRYRHGQQELLWGYQAAPVGSSTCCAATALWTPWSP